MLAQDEGAGWDARRRETWASPTLYRIRIKVMQCCAPAHDILPGTGALLVGLLAPGVELRSPKCAGVGHKAPHGPRKGSACTLSPVKRHAGGGGNRMQVLIELTTLHVMTQPVGSVLK